MKLDNSAMISPVQSNNSLSQSRAGDTFKLVKKDGSLGGKLLSQISPQERIDMPVAERVVIDAIEKANKAIMGANKRFEFSIHESTKEIVVKVIDTDTNDIIREIPNEKILDMVAKMCEMAGILVDERR